MLACPKNPAPTVFWQSGEQPAVSTPMEVFPAGRGGTASRASRSTRHGSGVIVGDDPVAHPGGDETPPGIRGGPFLNRSIFALSQESNGAHDEFLAP